MLNALMCAYNSGDVIGLALKQLIDAPCVTRILIADGPHSGRKFGHLPAEPTVGSIVKALASPKIVYKHMTDCRKLGEKCNRVLTHASADCKWMLVVDSDEVYHEKALARLATWLGTATYGRYAIKSLNPYPDFSHYFELPEWKPRLYQWFTDARCGMSADDDHQFVLHGQQRCKSGIGPRGCARIPESVCEFYHLNALRKNVTRVKRKPSGVVEWRGGGEVHRSGVMALSQSRIPRCIRELKRVTL